MTELAIWTFDWVPEFPRGFVRDLRLRWACEEAGLTYKSGQSLSTGARLIILIASHSAKFPT